MGNEPVRVTQLDNRGDERGWSFALPAHWLDFLGQIQNVHPMSIGPGRVRGNHFHEKKQELFLVFFTDAWTMLWDRGPDTAVESRSFDGSGVVMVEVEPPSSHAITNEGTRELFVIILSDYPFNPDHPDTHSRPVI